MGGYYTPNKRVRGLATVEQRPWDAKTLQCCMCQHQVLSVWFFIHPIKKHPKVLRPSAGHKDCRTPSKIAHYNSADGSLSIVDLYDTLKYCKHKRKECQCKECSPQSLCMHRKIWYFCS